ncbi:glycerophosphodiester phosphodiesterase family protein [Sphingobacterium sp. MYb382]|uniref:glycerophosphodiester phosphodiesterase family protein n=1 Tax=Sphingobacterium sp. MYb382 TaxID=2745278 RepID=UPI0030B2C30A
MKHLEKTLLIIASSLALSCSIQKENLNHAESHPSFSYEGHRGARGLYPENSIGAMKVAIDLPKVTTLEMDCHITKDNRVVVYHDHYLNPKFVQYTNGKPLQGIDDKGLIYAYTYGELGKFDIGTKYYTDFPEQKKVKTTISLLSDLIDEAESYAKEKRKKPMFYNIETKSKDGKDGEYHPSPQEFSDLILQVLTEKGIVARTVIQSFDKRTIQYINKVYPQVKLSYLIDAKNEQPIQEIIDELGFTPFIISPNFKLVTKAFMQEAHKHNIKVIPWTVNDKNEIQRLQSLKVDGIISDYPNLF